EATSPKWSAPASHATWRCRAPPDQDRLAAAHEIAGEDYCEPQKRKCTTHRVPGAVSMSKVPLRGELQGPALNRAPVALEELPRGNRCEFAGRCIGIVLRLAGAIRVAGIPRDGQSVAQADDEARRQ